MQARKARNRLSVAKSIPSAGRGEGIVKVADKPLPSPRSAAAREIPDSHVEAQTEDAEVVEQKVEQEEEPTTREEAPANNSVCSACNSENTPGFSFCDECGAPAKQETPQMAARKATVRKLLQEKAAAKAKLSESEGEK